MKLRYPAEAFALGIILFSAGMKEAFAAGILVIFTSVFAELLKNLLEKAVPVADSGKAVPFIPAALEAYIYNHVGYGCEHAVYQKIRIFMLKVNQGRSKDRHGAYQPYHGFPHTGTVAQITRGQHQYFYAHHHIARAVKRTSLV